MAANRALLKLDPAHSRAVALVFVLAGLLAITCLELLRWRYLQNITAAGFSPWGDDGFYIHNIPGQALAVTSLQAHGGLLLAAVTVAGTAAVLCGIAAALDMHLPFRVIGKTTLLACLLLPLCALLIFTSVQSPPVLTVTLSQNLLTVSTGIDISLPSITQFNFYWVHNGKHGHEELGAVVNNSQQVGLLTVGGTFHYTPSWEAQHLAQALQQYIGSGGTVFPAS